ncbi:hypothetical protein BBP18_05765 [Bacillus velezensis]|nr:hypothetical protein BBP18_05765 [Bacillus velezensis]
MTAIPSGFACFVCPIVCSVIPPIAITGMESVRLISESRLMPLASSPCLHSVSNIWPNTT